ncbi:hypothetical protein RD792_004398 [Penstemon davidsonii]|uniref:RING-type domain-containing protein n=1 Tax=Penstemon davidsonii TaxID=160366 RepID=A0ABR0DHD2_9LAMI|nr:hypothetical protein RD792_004398 [Penstemon davidsonii]
MTSVYDPQDLPPHVDTTTKSSSTSIIVVVVVIASAAILSIIINRLLRRFRMLDASANDASNELASVVIEDNNDNGECTVCLSEFEPNEQLRFLPCSHVFHAECVDSWLLTSRTCPLCMSAVPDEDETLG